jgi:hypothetical protein
MPSMTSPAKTGAAKESRTKMQIAKCRTRFIRMFVQC